MSSVMRRRLAVAACPPVVSVLLDCLLAREVQRRLVTRSEPSADWRSRAHLWWRRHPLQRTHGDLRGARLHRLDPSKRDPDDAEITKTRWVGRAYLHKQRIKSSPSGRACTHPRLSPPHRGQSTHVGRPRERLTPRHQPAPLYLLHSTHMIGVQLLAHARSTLRQITNSVLSKQSARLGTMESTVCDVRPSERANCAFVSTTSTSLRHERATMPCTAAADEPNSVAWRNTSFTLRCNCGAANGTSTSCWINLMIVLCTWRERNA